MSDLGADLSDGLNIDEELAELIFEEDVLKRLKALESTQDLARGNRRSLWKEIQAVRERVQNVEGRRAMLRRWMGL